MEGRGETPASRNYRSFVEDETDSKMRGRVEAKYYTATCTEWRTQKKNSWGNLPSSRLLPLLARMIRNSEIQMTGNDPSAATKRKSRFILLNLRDLFYGNWRTQFTAQPERNKETSKCIPSPLETVVQMRKKLYKRLLNHKAGYF